MLAHSAQLDADKKLQSVRDAQPHLSSYSLFHEQSLVGFSSPVSRSFAYLVSLYYPKATAILAPFVCEFAVQRATIVEHLISVMLSLSSNEARKKRNMVIHAPLSHR